MHPVFLDDEDQIAPPRTLRQSLGDGAFTLRSPEALRPYARCVGEWLERWAQETPDTLALAERDAGGEQWRGLSYGQLRREVGAVAQSLLDLKLPAGRPIAILSDNAVDHAVLMLAASCVVSSAWIGMMDTALPWPISVSTSSSRRRADVGIDTVCTAPWSSWKSICWVSARVLRTVDSARPDSRARAMSSAEGRVLGMAGAFIRGLFVGSRYALKPL